MPRNVEDSFGCTKKEQHCINAVQAVMKRLPDTDEILISDNSDVGIYEAVMEGVIVGGIAYRKVGNLVTLLVTSVFPEFRGKGIPSKLLRGVLDKIRTRGETLAVKCPFAAEFIVSHAEYADLLDTVHARRHPTRDPTSDRAGLYKIDKLY
ncbi:putative GNAT family acetyltransferase [Pseudarthrobacter sp. W1I19]|uniref:GNAT family N-acetyltransferase n=1 Tax=Pseudarthrobacter sp. W1I19 TaxID=3042288 RepID=UPI0027844FF1|nr:GNAT family N-acetyltransferase [Pseudarthrobacter sp. W1I19]MDQ0923819.1 putative GNAT family acetyltransferase [Pseudarthrobacter sp. W1I19]